MSEREARILGATATITVNGEEYQLSPVGLGALQELQRLCLMYYKRQYMASLLQDSIEVLGEVEGRKLLREELLMSAKWGIPDLPQQVAYDVEGVPITAKLTKHLKQLFPDLGEEETTVRSALSSGLDQGLVDSDKVKELTKIRPRQAKIKYDAWWITGTFEGMNALVWTSLTPKHPKISKKEISNWPISSLMEAAKTAEMLTTPAVGNI